MAAPMTKILIETVNSIYQYLGHSDSAIDSNTIFQEPRISRQSPDKCDLCFPLISLGGCDAYVPAVVLFPEFKTYKIKVNIEQVKEELPTVSKEWLLPVKSCSTSANNLCVLLDHEKSLKNTVCRILPESIATEVLTSNPASEKSTCYPKVVKISKDSLLVDKEVADLTQLRTLLAFQSLLNVYSYLGFKVERKMKGDINDSSADKFHVCYKSMCSEKHSEYSLIHCGAVLDFATGVKATIYSKDYYRLKCRIFENVAEERDNSQDNMVQAKYLSDAEVVADLLWVKLHDHVSVSLSEDPEENRVSRGATFLLYNHVRISCIIKKFEKEVECGNYPKLPTLDRIDFGLLIQREEWELLLLIIQFPYWLVNCISPKGKISLHPVLIGMDKLCRVFSVYYRRVRVLVEPRPHLLPLMYARLYLLRCVEHVLGIGLSIFNMKSLDHM